MHLNSTVERDYLGRGQQQLFLELRGRPSARQQHLEFRQWRTLPSRHGHTGEFVPK